MQKHNINTCFIKFSKVFFDNIKELTFLILYIK